MYHDGMLNIYANRVNHLYFIRYDRIITGDKTTSLDIKIIEKETFLNTFKIYLLQMNI